MTGGGSAVTGGGTTTGGGSAVGGGSATGGGTPSPSAVREVRLGTVSGVSYGFIEYLPQGYATGSNFPVVIFLHGSGQVGNGTTQLSAVRQVGPPRYVDTGTNYPFVMISPQTGGSWSSWEMENLMGSLLTHVLATYKVDPKRLYVTGLSLGGSGTWDLARFHSDKVAALLPVCGGSWGFSQTEADRIVNANIAVWTFHGTADGQTAIMTDDQWISMMGITLGSQQTSVTSNYPTNAVGPYSATYNAQTHAWVWVQGQTPLTTGGATPGYQVIYTRIGGGPHSIWDSVYTDPQVFNWLLQQHRP